MGKPGRASRLKTQPRRRLRTGSCPLPPGPVAALGCGALMFGAPQTSAWGAFTSAQHGLCTCWGDAAGPAWSPGACVFLDSVQAPVRASESLVAGSAQPAWGRLTPLRRSPPRPSPIRWDHSDSEVNLPGIEPRCPQQPRAHGHTSPGEFPSFPDPSPPFIWCFPAQLPLKGFVLSSGFCRYFWGELHFPRLCLGGTECYSCSHPGAPPSQE